MSKTQIDTLLMVSDKGEKQLKHQTLIFFILI